MANPNFTFWHLTANLYWAIESSISYQREAKSFNGTFLLQTKPLETTHCLLQDLTYLSSNEIVNSGFKEENV
jgi:hypothetical protein